MSLSAAINRYLHDDLLTRLAQASAMSVAEARKYSAVAVPTLVRQLAQPTDADELNARWDMCRQLYLSQMLTDTDELLRTDLGWTDRRRYLAEKILGQAQLEALAANSSLTPVAASTMQGYLTTLALAVVGEQASTADLEPIALGLWLREQQVPAVANIPAAASRQSTAAKPKVTPAPAVSATSRYLKIASVVGVLALVGGGGYMMVNTPANASADPAAPAENKATEVSAAALPSTTAPAAEPAPAAPVATPLEVPAAKPTEATAAKAAGAVLRDTIGNAAMARTIGGKFNIVAGRYIKGEGQPLTIKLANHATLVVGINSTESLLYKRLVNPNLPRPTDLVLDRLAFDNSQARLGAEGAQQLGSVASLLKTFPKARLLVLGHANNSETDATKLGLKRATVAMEELQKQGIKLERLQAQGVMATGMPTDNDTPERQAMLQGISLKISKL